MFQLLLLSTLCCSFLQAADHTPVPFKNPALLFSEDTRKEQAVGLFCGAIVGAAGCYAGKQINDDLSCLIIFPICGVSTTGFMKRASKFHSSYKNMGRDIAQKYAGDRTVPEDITAFIAAYGQLITAVKQNSVPEKEEIECNDILKKISGEIDEELQSYPKVRDEHNKLYAHLLKEHKLLTFAHGFVIGSLFGPIGLYIIAKDV